MKRKMETGEDGSLEPLKALFGEVTDPDIVAKKKRIYKKCPHEKRKHTCRICTPKIVCPHKILEKCCRICTQKLICEHEILERNCRICTPKIVCKHKLLEKNCRICTPKLICKHEILTRNCRECGGSAYCECEIQKALCPKHGGSALCIGCFLVPYNPKYDKHCIDCFVNLHPSDPRSDRKSRLKRRETVVREAIDDMFEGFIHDKAFSTGGCCPHRREIDHRILINGTVLAVETDENAHVSYNKQNEINRYDDLFMAISTKFVFIRFNCDTTREDYGAKTSLDHKIQALLSCIGTQITRIRNNENTELCEIVKLFYCKKCSNNGSDICLCPP